MKKITVLLITLALVFTLSGCTDEMQVIIDENAITLTEQATELSTLQENLTQLQTDLEVSILANGVDIDALEDQIADVEADIIAQVALINDTIDELEVSISAVDADLVAQIAIVQTNIDAIEAARLADIIVLQDNIDTMGSRWSDGLYIPGIYEGRFGSVDIVTVDDNGTPADTTDDITENINVTYLATVFVDVNGKIAGIHHDKHLWEELDDLNDPVYSDGLLNPGYSVVMDTITYSNPSVPEMDDMAVAMAAPATGYTWNDVNVNMTLDAGDTFKYINFMSGAEVFITMTSETAGTGEASWCSGFWCTPVDGTFDATNISFTNIYYTYRAVTSDFVEGVAIDNAEMQEAAVANALEAAELPVGTEIVEDTTQGEYNPGTYAVVLGNEMNDYYYKIDYNAGDRLVAVVVIDENGNFVGSVLHYISYIAENKDFNNIDTIYYKTEKYAEVYGTDDPDKFPGATEKYFGQAFKVYYLEEKTYNEETAMTSGYSTYYKSGDDYITSSKKFVWNTISGTYDYYVWDTEAIVDDNGTPGDETDDIYTAGWVISTDYTYVTAQEEYMSDYTGLLVNYNYEETIIEKNIKIIEWFENGIKYTYDAFSEKVIIIHFYDDITD